MKMICMRKMCQLATRVLALRRPCRVVKLRGHQHGPLDHPLHTRYGPHGSPASQQADVNDKLCELTN